MWLLSSSVRLLKNPNENKFVRKKKEKKRKRLFTLEIIRLRFIKVSLLCKQHLKTVTCQNSAKLPLLRGEMRNDMLY